ncbi:PQQ-binding-like beta-propeller repeat protein [Streptomyces sp. NPDC048161]|uniref:outer membrane protein assembly factor BamB family protein n=1 Tax=Streptomyces sp. NPDC048161 TaxID=3160985 RepID=UPI0033C4FCCF
MSRKKDQRDHSAARRRLAKERRWTYTDWHPERMQLCAAPLGVDAEKARALDAVSGTLDGHWFSVFDCVTDNPSAARTVYLVQLPAVLPLVAVSRHSLAVDTMVPLLKRLVTERPDRDLYEIGDPAYDANHVVESVDPEVAARLLTPAVRELADDRRWLQWQVEGGYLVYAAPPGSRREQDDSHTILTELRSLVDMVEAMDPGLWGEAAGAAPGVGEGRAAAETEMEVETEGNPGDAEGGSADAVPPAVPDTVPRAVSDAVPTAGAEPGPRPGSGPSAMFRGGPAHTGVYPKGTLPAGFEAWSVRLPDAVVAAPVVCAGTVYVNCSDGRCYALDAVTGAARWSFDAVGALKETPAVADGTVYVVGQSGVLHALDAADGQERWRQRVGHSGAPVVADGLLHLVHHPANLLRDASRIRALDAATGEERWARRLPDGSAAAAAVADGRVYVQGARAQLTAFDAVSGEELWHQGSTAAQLSCCTPSVAGGMVCAGTGAGRLYAYDAATGQQRWGAQAAGVVDSTPALAEGLVFVGDSHSGVYAMDGNDGGLLWHLPDRYGASSPAICGSSGWIVGTKYGRGLFKISLSTGVVLWRHALDGRGTGPVHADGVVYVGTHAGTVLAVDAETGRKPVRARRRMRV